MSLGSTGKKIAVALLLVVATALGGCATPPTNPEQRKYFDQVNDPLEPTNRVIYKFNHIIYGMLLKPPAKLYTVLVPDAGQRGVHNVLENMSDPDIFVNQLLEGRFDYAGITLGRFIINSTLGIGGIFDVARDTFHLDPHHADLGMTFALWGIKPGPYLVLPLFGPSDPRDAIGLGIDTYFDPLDMYLDRHSLSDLVLAQSGATALDLGARELPALDEIERTSLDPYAAVRSMYRQHRYHQIHGQPDTANMPDANPPK